MVVLSEKVDTQPKMSHGTKKKIKRDNSEAVSPEPYCRRVFPIALIDKLISVLEVRFTKRSYSVSTLLFFIPKIK